MWNFKISYIGSAISIFIIAFSLFVEWIYMANVRIKYQKIDLNSKVTPVKHAKNILDKKKIKVHFKRDSNFFLNDFDLVKKIIRLENRVFFNNSIHDNVNCVFLSYKYSLVNNVRWKSFWSYVAKIVIAFLSINLIWTLFFGLWIVIIALWIFYVIVAFLFIWINLILDIKATRFSIEYLKVKINANLFILVKKYAKYKRIESFINILKMFTTPMIDLIKIIKDWGKDE